MHACEGVRPEDPSRALVGHDGVVVASATKASPARVATPKSQPMRPWEGGICGMRGEVGGMWMVEALQASKDHLILQENQGENAINIPIV